MKFTLSWLKDHLDTDASLDKIVETLTLIGLEVEGVEDPGAKLKGYVIGHVVEAKPHPNADRLQVLTVEAGQGPLQVVCGAPNARAGLKGVFSPPGTYIPGKGITLEVGTIRGVESFGMMCSEAELEISDDHHGIIELPADAPVGVPYAEWAGLDDPVIDVAVTPNRADALGRPRHRPRPRRRRSRQAEGPRAEAGRRQVPLPGERHARFRHDRESMPGVCAAPRQGRQERPLAGRGCRSGCAPSAFGRSTPWSTSPIISPSTAAGRCTCSTPRR